MKTKDEGVALLVSLGISFLTLGISVAVLNSVRRSVEQNENIERASQVFFAAESGTEAAFFHHNARHQGVHFMEDPVGESQKILHSSDSVEVSWRIAGRTAPIIGILKEGEVVKIPLYWDSASNPTDPPANSGAFISPEVFGLRFYTNVQAGGDALTQALISDPKTQKF